MHLVNPLIRDAEPANTGRTARSIKPIRWRSIRCTHVDKPTNAREWFASVVAFAHQDAPHGNILEAIASGWQRRFANDPDIDWLKAQMEMLWVWFDDSHRPLQPSDPRLVWMHDAWYWVCAGPQPRTWRVAVATEGLFPEHEHWHLVIHASSRDEAVKLFAVGPPPEDPQTSS